MNGLPESAFGRAAHYLNMIASEHGHPESLEAEHLVENAHAFERCFEGTGLDYDEINAVAAQTAIATSAHLVLAIESNGGTLDMGQVVFMFKGMFAMGVAIGARAAAGLHEDES